jgi:ketosteroid isomerase-like protein
MKPHLVIGVTLILILSTLSSCRWKQKKTMEEVFKTEILETEKEFAAMAREKGIAEAFYTFADENAVIKRANDTLIMGKENIRKFYSKPVFKEATLTWTPDFVDVSGDGMMGYTYGKYNWTSKDGEGRLVAHTGVFHTVWKHLPDGTWKYVWD